MRGIHPCAEFWNSNFGYRILDLKKLIGFICLLFPLVGLSSSDKETLVSEIKALHLEISKSTIPKEREILQTAFFKKVHQFLKNEGISKSNRASSTPSGKHPSAATILASISLPPPQNQTEARRFRVFCVEELSLGKERQDAIEEIARLIRIKDFSAARSQWNSLLKRESQIFQKHKKHLHGVIDYIIRQAYIEPHEVLNIAAFYIDDSKKKRDPSLVLQNQAEFDVLLEANKEIAQMVEKTSKLLRDVAHQHFQF